MRPTTLLASCLTLVVAVGSVRADCPLDHFRVGQDDGRLICDAWQVYRHWNSDYGSNPNPYAQPYYEWIQTIMGTYNRTEPGPGYVEDANYHFPGTPNVDYRIMLQRVYASPELGIYENLTPILENDGDAVCTSTYPEFHFHLRFMVADEPNEPRYVLFRYYDDFFDPNDPNAGGYAPSRPWVVHFGAEPNYYALDVFNLAEDYGTVLISPDAPMPISLGQHYDPNAEPNDPPAYPEGLPVTLVAEPVEGKSFREWRVFDANYPGDANYATIDSNMTLTLVMDRDTQVEAVFKCGSGTGMLPLGLTLLAVVGTVSPNRQRRRSM